MLIKDITEKLITDITRGDEKAFSSLYDCYYTYLNTVAIYYVTDREVACEVVNDVFINVWHKRSTLIFPIHSYLIKSVKNGCLNSIRSQKSKDRVLGEHKQHLLDFQEEYILSNPTPLQFVESQEMEAEIRGAINQLPEKCKIIFEQFLFSGKLPEEIASDQLLSVSTVRVQIKNAMDKLKISLQHLIGFALLLVLRALH
jgi:RNA polymerase sigma-70 factor (family 1)